MKQHIFISHSEPMRHRCGAMVGDVMCMKLAAHPVHLPPQAEGPRCVRHCGHSPTWMGWSTKDGKPECRYPVLIPGYKANYRLCGHRCTPAAVSAQVGEPPKRLHYPFGWDAQCSECEKERQAYEGTVTSPAVGEGEVPELLACPFCGGKARDNRRNQYYETVECENCTAETYHKDWNTRVPAPSVEALVEALEQAVSAAEHVIKICEADLERGRNASPAQRSMPSSVMAEAYAAMSFVNAARTAIAQAREEGVK